MANIVEKGSSRAFKFTEQYFTRWRRYENCFHPKTPAYSSLYLSNFLSFHTLNDEIFSKTV